MNNALARKKLLLYHYTRTHTAISHHVCIPIDRCVSKYLDSQQLVGEVLRKANEAQLQQQQQMMQLQQQIGG